MHSVRLVNYCYAVTLHPQFVNPSIVIKQTDKGSTIVVQNMPEYIAINGAGFQLLKKMKMCGNSEVNEL